MKYFCFGSLVYLDMLLIIPINVSLVAQSRTLILRLICTIETSGTIVDFFNVLVYATFLSASNSFLNNHCFPSNDSWLNKTKIVDSNIDIYSKMESTSSLTRTLVNNWTSICLTRQMLICIRQIMTNVIKPHDFDTVWSPHILWIKIFI